MKSLAAVARREIVQRRGVFLTALVAGIGAAAVNIFPLERSWTHDAREAAAVVTALLLAAGVSLLLGAFGLSRDIATRRIGFDLARPVSSFSLWAGRLGAAAVLTAGAAAIAALPTLLIHRGEVSAEIELIFLSGVAIAVFLLLPIAHAAGIAFRSRSPWIAADIVLFLVMAGIAAVSFRFPLSGMPPAAASRGLIALGVLLVAAVVGAGLAAVAAGRADIQAAHRAFSRTFWPAALAAAALFAVYANWAVSVAPGDLAWIWLSPSPRGDWTTLSGRAASRGEDGALFLFKTSTGRFVKLKSDEARPVFSADGRAAVWLEAGRSLSFLSLRSRPEWMGGSRPARFYRFAPLEGSVEPVATDVLLSSAPRAWTVSADGARVAAINDEPDGASASRVSVYELSTGRLLAAAAIPPNIGAHLVFVAPDRLRIYLEEPSESAVAGEARRGLGIHEMDVAGKTLAQTGQMGPFAGFLVLRTDAAASRAIAIDPRGRRMTLHDGRSGRQIAILSSGERQSRNAAFLGDGRVAEVESSGAGARLRVFSPEGEEQKTVPVRFGDGWRIALGGETAPGVVLVVVRSESAEWKDSECLLVDTRTGQTQSIGKRIFPAAAMAWWGRDDPSWYPAAGSEATKLFLDARGSLIRLDPATGARRVILAGPSR